MHIKLRYKKGSANTMNIAIVLSGGIGTRVGHQIPKQYIEVEGTPIIQYSLKALQNNTITDGIVIVAASEWQRRIHEWVKRDKIDKFVAFALAGNSRQESIVNGMNVINKMYTKDEINIIIHDAARPNLTDELITKCFEGLQKADGVLPVLPVKDTIYLSQDGKSISSLLNRDQLFAGQAPESFKFKKYFDIHKGLTEEDLTAIRGSSEIAYKNNLNISLISGDEHNYKITTKTDLEKFKTEMRK